MWSFTCDYKIAQVFVRVHLSLKNFSVRGSIEILLWHNFIFLPALIICKVGFGGLPTLLSTL